MGDGKLTQPEIDALVNGGEPENSATEMEDSPRIEEAAAASTEPIKTGEKSGPALDYWQVRELCKLHDLFVNKCRVKRVAKQYIRNLNDAARESLEKEAKQHHIRYKKYALGEVQKILHQAIAEYENLTKLTDAIELPVAFRRAADEAGELTRTTSFEGEICIYNQRLFSATHIENAVKLTHRFEKEIQRVRLRITAEIARTYLSYDKVLALESGDVIEFDRLAGEAIDVFVERQIIAAGEIVVIDNHFGVRVTGIADSATASDSEGSLSLVFDGPHCVARLILGSGLKTVSDLRELTEGSIVEFGRTNDSPWRLEIGRDELKPDFICLGELLVRKDVICFEIIAMSGQNPTSKRRAQAKQPKAKKKNIPRGQSVKTLTKENLTSLLLKMPQRNLVNFLRCQNPQTCALVLSLTDDSGACARILEELPENLQPEIVRRIANGVSVPDWVLTELHVELEPQAAAEKPVNAGGGVKPAAQIVAMSRRATERFIVESLEKEDPEMAENIKQNILVFEDIVLLDDRAIQKVLRELDNQDLARALKAVDTEVQEKIFRNMSQRAQLLLREDMEFLGAIRLSEVEAAHQKIVNVMRQLEENGDIIIARYGDDEPWVTT